MLAYIKENVSPIFLYQAKKEGKMENDIEGEQYSDKALGMKPEV